MATTDAVSISKTIESLGSDYSNKDIDWVKFVYDHYQIIFGNCRYEPISGEKHYWEYYRLEDYLRDVGIDPNCAWIVLYINQMKSNMDFKECEGLLLPDMAIIKSLYQSFRQYRSHIKSIRR